MSIFDAFDVLDILELLVSWRFFLAAAVGIGVALAVYFMSGETPAAAAVAFGIGLAGLIAGFVWEYDHVRRR